MATISWGKSLLETTTSKDGAPEGTPTWKTIDTPKDGTTKLTATAGQEIEALEEGGEVVDSRRSKNKYQLEFDLFVKKGKERAWEDNDGIIAGEHAFRLTPEDEGCEGFIIDRCTLSVEESFTTADGIMLHYVAKVLKPRTGKMVKPYTKGV